MTSTSSRPLYIQRQHRPKHGAHRNDLDAEHHSLYKAGPADHDYLKIASGHFIISLDRRPLKTTDNYWRAVQVASGTKFHFTINDKPTAEGAWEVSISRRTGVNGPICSTRSGLTIGATWSPD